MALSLERYHIHYHNPRFTSLLKERYRKERERSREIVLNKIDHQPDNLIFEILSWLPVKDLLQYKSVSKSWYAIISSPNFIAKHLKNYYHNNDDWGQCLLAQLHTYPCELILYELFVDDTPQVLADTVLFGVPIYGSIVYGPCDGLYYLFICGSNCRALWNPAINEFEYLPNIVYKPDLPAIFIANTNNDGYGLGLDSITGDYKVVVIQEYWNTDDGSDIEHPASVLVYSLRTNSWRYCGDLSKAYHLTRNTCYIYVHGCSYWFGTFTPNDYNSEVLKVVISFDFATDAYNEIDVPDYADKNSRLGIYDDCLALLSFRWNKILDIWIMNDEGSWTKKLTVGPFPDVAYPIIGHWKDNRIMLRNAESNTLSFYDPETQEVKDFWFHERCKSVYVYRESLVSIKRKELEQSRETEVENNQAK